MPTTTSPPSSPPCNRRCRKTLSPLPTAPVSRCRLGTTTKAKRHPQSAQQLTGLSRRWGTASSKTSDPKGHSRRPRRRSSRGSGFPMMGLLRRTMMHMLWSWEHWTLCSSFMASVCQFAQLLFFFCGFQLFCPSCYRKFNPFLGGKLVFFGWWTMVLIRHGRIECVL